MGADRIAEIVYAMSEEHCPSCAADAAAKENPAAQPKAAA